LTYRNDDSNALVNINDAKVDQRDRSGKVEKKASTRGAVIGIPDRFLLVLNNQQVAKRLAVGYS
jgi:hypothetical protein